MRQSLSKKLRAALAALILHPCQHAAAEIDFSSVDLVSELRPPASQNGVYLSLRSDHCAGHRSYIIDTDVLRAHTFESELGELKSDLTDECTAGAILIHGPITEGLVDQIKRALLIQNALDNDLSTYPHLYLDSPGGSVAEALKIGDLLSRSYVLTAVDREDTCLSSCVMILAAGATREVGGKVGIHKPFARDLNIETDSFSEYNSKYLEVSESLRAYFEGMGVSPGIVERMNNTPSDKIDYLSGDDLEVLGLGIENVAFTEFVKARIISNCGSDSYDKFMTIKNQLKQCPSTKADCLKPSPEVIEIYQNEYIECRGIPLSPPIFVHGDF